MTQAYRPLLGADLFADSFGYLNGTDDALRTHFAGTAAPSDPLAHQVWADTTAGLLKMRNGANDAWIVIGILGVSYLGLLPLAGGTMTGGINMGGQTVTNLGQGSGAAAARVQEVDLKAPIAAPQFTGDAQVNQDPVGNNSLVRKSWTEGRYLKLTGGTLTGDLTLASYAGAAYQPVAREQLENFISFSTSVGHRHDGLDARRVRGTDIDSGAGAANTVATANGSGGTSWATVDAQIAAQAINQSKLKTDPIEITYSHGSPSEADVQVTIGGFTAYTFLPLLKGPGGASETSFKGLKAIGLTSYGMSKVLLAVAGNGTHYAQFRYVNA